MFVFPVIYFRFLFLRIVLTTFRVGCGKTSHDDAVLGLRGIAAAMPPPSLSMRTAHRRLTSCLEWD